MTTYQNIVDYMNKHYNGKFTLFIQDGYYTINDNDDDYYTICINKDSYSTIGSFTIGKGLNKLLTGILNTPVNQRINSEIKHTIKPVTKENVDTVNLVNGLTNVDQVIRAINTFIVRTKHNASEWIMFINTDLSIAKLNEIFKLYSDYNIKIYNHRNLSPEYDLLIEPK